MDRSEAYHKRMTEDSVSKIIISLGIPTTISMLITNIYNMADTYFVGGLGDSAQAATGILFTLQCIIQAVAFMLGHGAGTYVAKYLAQKNIDRASCYCTTAFVCGGVIGALMTALGLSFLEPFLRFLGSTETILPYARTTACGFLFPAHSSFARLCLITYFVMREKHFMQCSV